MIFFTRFAVLTRTGIYCRFPRTRFTDLISLVLYILADGDSLRVLGNQVFFFQMAILFVHVTKTAFIFIIDPIFNRFLLMDDAGKPRSLSLGHSLLVLRRIHLS